MLARYNLWELYRVDIRRSVLPQPKADPPLAEINSVAYFFLIFILLIQTILFLGHWFLYKTIVRFLGISNPATLLSLRWGLGILSLLFVLASLVAFRYYNLFTRVLYSLAAAWLGIFYFLLLACILIWISAMLPIDHKLTAKIFLAVGLLFGIYSLINAGYVRTTSLTVKLPNLPASWQGKTAVWISDLHLGQIRNYGFAKNVANKISALHPDMVFIGGDLYDGVAVDVNRAIEPFAKLKTSQGTYFITGNHEEFGDDTKYLNAVKNAGITILNDQVLNLDGLQLIGVDYRDSSNPANYQKILNGFNINPNLSSILLKHEPNNLDITEQAGINFQISGHTHRAQAWPFSYVPRSFYKGFDYGLKTMGKMQVYTSSGVGTWGPPIRFLTFPEIVQIKFERAE